MEVFVCGCCDAMVPGRLKGRGHRIRKRLNVESNVLYAKIGAEMAVAGMFLKGNFAHIATLDGTQDKHALIDRDFKSMEMGKNPTQEDVAALREKIEKYVKKNGITQIVLNRRITAGQMAGAAGTFLWEGILLAVSPVPLTFLHAATIRATDKKKGTLKTLRSGDPENAFLDKAYDFGFEGLK